MLDCLNNFLFQKTLKEIEEDKPFDKDFQEQSWSKIQSLTLKQLFIYNKNEIYEKYIGYINQTNLIKRKTINQVVKDFLGNELFSQRTMLIQLLIKSYEPDFQYLAYLLYDLLSNDNNNNIDTQEQTLLFDSLPWTVKKYFRDSMKQTIEYTNNLANFDNNKIPIEQQQICLLKTCDNVKEKAMQKLKEVKSKSDDSGSKARQYLDGLLKIPFGIYKEEDILNKIKTIKDLFNEIVDGIKETQIIDINKKDHYNNLEIINYLSEFKNNLINIPNKLKTSTFEKLINSNNRSSLINTCNIINNLIKKYEIKTLKISTSGKNLDNIKNQIDKFLDIVINNKEFMEDMINQSIQDKNSLITLNNIEFYINNICEKQSELSNYMIKINNTLDNAVYGHSKAKRQVERIIGQWMNGEKSGYCFGFEGPPELVKHL